jgi:hypothetical protein
MALSSQSNKYHRDDGRHRSPVKVKPKPRILFHTKRPRIIPDLQPSQDPVFTRLILDLQLARRVQQQVARGMRPQTELCDAITLERGAFQHLFNYLNARAWVRTKELDE